MLGRALTVLTHKGNISKAEPDYLATCVLLMSTGAAELSLQTPP